MNEHPILFGGEAVRAILDGRKTQTRRVINPQSFKLDGGGHPYIDMGYPDEWDGAGLRRDILCPYGQPGDLLWVRETWNSDQQYASWKPSEIPQGAPLYYKADESGKPDPDGITPIWRPSIHMPRWASRIALRVTDVRVERVQDITDYDCQCEGLLHNNYSNNIRGQFTDLWDSINAKRGYSWSSNPWVWVVEFRREVKDG